MCWGWLKKNFAFCIDFFKISAIFRALTILDNGTLGTFLPLIMIEPLFNSA